MRVATFNVDSLDTTTDAAVALDDRIPILRPQLERLRANILCLQEINGQHSPGVGPRTLRALDRLLEGTRYQTFARAVTTAHRGREYDHDQSKEFSRNPSAILKYKDALNQFYVVEVRRPQRHSGMSLEGVRQAAGRVSLWRPARPRHELDHTT
jgi:hypothetical protein